MTRLLKLTKPYMKGEDVREAQIFLNSFGFKCEIDGVFGSETKSAVIAFQKSNGLKADGIIGTITWGALHKNIPVSENPISKFTQWIAEQEGNIYVWGGQGQIATEAFITARETDITYRNQALALFRQRVAAGLKDIKAFDCSGLIVCYLLDNKLISSDKTANGLYFDVCTPIDRTELKQGDLVFKKYALRNAMYHVGVYMGDGTVVHAKGRASGVIMESINATNWNRYGRIKNL